MNSTTARLTKVFQQHPYYFNEYLSHYYPFTIEEIKRYQSILNWECLSTNMNLDWNEGLLMKFKDLWDWYKVSWYTFGLKGLSNPQLVKKYLDLGLLDNSVIIDNYQIEWTKDLVQELGYEIEDTVFNDKTARLYKWDFERVTTVLERLKQSSRYQGVEDINTLVDFIDVEWSDELIDNYIDDIEFQIAPPFSKPFKQRYNNEGDYPWQYRYEVQMKTTPKEIEEIVSLLEKYGHKLIPKSEESYKPYQPSSMIDYFLFSNPEGKGVDFTFNTPEKRKILEEAITEFYYYYDEIVTRLKRTMIYKEKEVERDKREQDNISKDRHLYFHKIGGAGIIRCKNCVYEEEIISFIHGLNSSSTGLQCPCGKFHAVKNWSKKSNIFLCSCGEVPSRDNPLFCPRCKSNRVEYDMLYIT